MAKNLTLLAAAAAVLLGASVQTQPTLAQPATKPKTATTTTAVTIAQFGHVFLYMPLYVALRGGFFREQGLDVKLVSTGGDEKTFTADSTGNAQFGVSDPTFAAIAREHGQGGKVVAGIVKGNALLGDHL